MPDPRRATKHQRMKHRMVTQWRGVADGPLIDLPARQASDGLEKVLKDLGLTDQLRLEEVVSAWKVAAGDFISRHATPDAFAKGVLTVRVSQSSVHHAMTMEKPALLRRLNEAMGGNKIKDVRFRHG